MANATDYLEGQLASHLFGSTAYTRPAGLWIALFTAAPSDAGGGTEVSTTSTGYSRFSLAPSTTNWAMPSGGNGQVSNVPAISFPAATASWGTITHFAIFDASTGGNMLIWGAWHASKAIAATDVFNVAANALKITFA